MQEDLALIREYEELRRSLARHERQCGSLRRRMAELERSGRLALPRYFGEFPPPGHTPQGKARRWQRLSDGVFLVRARDTALLAVHEAVAERYLTAVAAACGEFLGEFCFFGESMAVALFELSESFPEVRAQLELPKLHATLYARFPAYAAFYNDIRAGIPEPQPGTAAAPYLRIRL